MNKRFFFLISMMGLILVMIYGCEKDKPINNIGLLTNGSSKIWFIKKIVTNDLITIELPSCETDDERKFMIDGKYLVNNMGTIPKIDNSPIINATPPRCEDTLNITYTYNWNFNSTMDTLTIYYASFIAISKIQKLTNDSLIIKYAVNDTWFQTDFYVAKETK
jgi:hypothetical protein